MHKTLQHFWEALVHACGRPWQPPNYLVPVLAGDTDGYSATSGSGWNQKIWIRYIPNLYMMMMMMMMTRTIRRCCSLCDASVNIDYVHNCCVLLRLLSRIDVQLLIGYHAYHHWHWYLEYYCCHMYTVCYMYTVSRKKRPKCFSVISPIKLEQLWWNLVHRLLNKLAAKWCKRFPPQLNFASTLPCETWNAHCK